MASNPTPIDTAGVRDQIAPPSPHHRHREPICPVAACLIHRLCDEIDQLREALESRKRGDAVLRDLRRASAETSNDPKPADVRYLTAEERRRMAPPFPPEETT